MMNRNKVTQLKARRRSRR